METRTLEGFILAHDYLILTGNHIIDGNVYIENGNLIVSGDLTINGNITIQNGNLIVSGYLKIVNCEYISIVGDISSEKLNIECNNNFEIRIYGDIYVAGNSLISNDLNCNEFNIVGSSNSKSIECLNCLIGGNNNSIDIKAEEDIYILGCNYSHNLFGRDIFINGEADFYGSALNASRATYIGGPITECSSFSNGK